MSILEIDEGVTKMSFLHPEFLYYMLPPMFILFFLLLTQKSEQESFFSQEVMDKLRVSANTLTLKARNALFLLMGILMVLALSGPVINEGTVEIKAKSADIMIALDISDSMLGEDVYPNRLKLAKQKALTLLRLAPNERVGVIGFAKNSYLVSPLSFDHAAVGFLLRQLNTDSITEKGTSFMTMLEVVNKSIKKESKKYLLILSDGGDIDDFSKEITYAKEHSIAIFVLGIGTSKGAPIKKADGTFVKQNGEIIVSKLNDNIKKLATQTGGVYIQSVNSDDDAEAMLREIEAHSEKKELKSQEIKRFIPLFYYPLGLALLILLIATSSMSKREKVQVPLAFIIALFISAVPDVNAGLLDFVELEKAKSAYEEGAYKKSEALYDNYQKQTDKSDVNYNIGNTLYKQGKYKEAIEAYKKANFKAKENHAKNLSNLGNAYVKSNDMKMLKKAVDSYEQSLKLEEDSDVRENLEAVKKFIEEQKKKKQNKQQNKDDKKDKNKKKDKKESDKDKKNKKSDKDEKSKDKKNKQESKKDKKSDKKSKDKKSDEEKKKQEAKDKAQKEKQEKAKKEKAKELKDNNTTSQAQPKPQPMQDKMSNEEEKKWLKQLNKQQSTYLYRLNDNNKIEEDSNEKPW